MDTGPSLGHAERSFASACAKEVQDRADIGRRAACGGDESTGRRAGVSPVVHERIRLRRPLAMRQEGGESHSARGPY